MNRQQLLVALEKGYSDIYEFTDQFDDAPLNILDEFTEAAGLRDEAFELLESQIDETDPTTLSDDILAKILRVYQDVIEECIFELQD